MLESDMEYLIAHYCKEFFSDLNLVLVKRQYPISGRRIDILFRNEKDENVIVEIKRGVLSREAVGQIAEYYGLIKLNITDNEIRLILCANRIPSERKVFLQKIGIDCYEFTENVIDNIATKHNYIYGSNEENVEQQINRTKIKHYNEGMVVDIAHLLEMIKTTDGREAIHTIVNRFNSTNKYQTHFKPYRNTFQCRILSIEEGKYYFSFIVNREYLHIYIMNSARLMLLMENSIMKIKEKFPKNEDK